MNNRSIGLQVSRLRKERNLSSTELARRCDLSQPQISRLENGKQGFRSATLARIAAALGVTPAYFFAAEEAALAKTQQRERAERGRRGKRQFDELLVQFGDVVLTPGFRQVIRQVTRALAREDCDARTLRRLIACVCRLSDEDRAALLDKLQNS